MANNLSQEMQDLIRNNLPEQVGQVLRQRLEQAERDVILVAAQAHDISELRARLAEATKQLASQEQMSKSADVLAKREASVQARERDVEVFETRLQVAESEKRAQLAKEFVSLVFRSPVYTRSTWGNRQVPLPNGGYTTNVTESSGESIKEE